MKYGSYFGTIPKTLRVKLTQTIKVEDVVFLTSLFWDFFFFLIGTIEPHIAPPYTCQHKPV